MEGNVMKRALVSALAMAAMGAVLLSSPAIAVVGGVSDFDLQVSPGAKTCLPYAQGHVTIDQTGPVENLRLQVSGLKPNTDYDFFIIQVPNAPFGLSWYQGDLETDQNGSGTGNFVGRFSVETFIVAPGAATVPLPVHPTDAAKTAKNPAIQAPIHTYHLGLWFNSPKDAASINCPGTVTPFNGDHKAGIQVLNSGNYPDDQGPLRSIRP
jgi:hypothetical protein